MRFFVAHYPTERLKKPSLFHSIRVGSYLFLQWYSKEICIAGLLHDALEDTSLTEEILKNTYGDWIAWAVKASSKNITLPKEEILQDIVKRCALHPEWALIVKSADVLDNFAYYTRCKEEWNEIEGEILRCRNIAKIIVEVLPSNYTDKIFKTIAELALF